MKKEKNLLKIGLFWVLVTYFCNVLRKCIKNVINNYEMETDRYMCYYYIMREWLINKQKGLSVIEYLRKNNIKRIAIYGLGTLGDMFYNEIKDTDIKVEYIIDQIADKKYHGIRVIKPEDINEQPLIDAIIITPICDYAEIVQKLEKYNTQISKISLEKLILLRE